MDVFKATAAQYLVGGQFSDFTIVCIGREYKVHRVIISSHSHYFARCCSGGFDEAMTRRVELKEDDSAAVARMVGFFYCFDYHDGDGVPQASPNSIQVNAQVFAVAEKYDVQGLKELAKTKYIAAVENGHTDSMVLAKAAQTVYHDIQLLDKDLVMLKSPLVAYWLYTEHRQLRAASLVAADARGENLRALCEANGEFMLDCQAALLSSLVSTTEIAAMILGTARRFP